VVVTTDLFTHLHQLSVSNGLDGDTLADALLAFTADLRAAVPSYLGLQLTIVENDRPVTLTEIKADRIATTSLRLPLAAVSPNVDPESWITLYAATAGAFVDLAADLGYSLNLPTATHAATGATGGSSDYHGQRVRDRRIVLDADLPPSTAFSGLSGLDELSTINRATGILIGQGHHSDRAGDTLRRNALHKGLRPHTHAAQLLRR